MRTPTRFMAVAGVSVLLALGGCGGGGEESSAEEGSGGPPACSDFSDGQEITEDLTLTGCQDDGVSTQELTSCEGHDLVAVGPVYGFVGKPANYLGDGEDATKSEEWETFKTECPYDSQ